MSDTLQVSVNQQVVDADNAVSEEKDYLISKTFTEKQEGTFVLATGVSYTTITFVDIVTATSLRIKSDQSINIKVNSGTQVLVVNKDLWWWGTITALQINNASGVDATITYELRG